MLLLFECSKLSFDLYISNHCLYETKSSLILQCSISTRGHSAFTFKVMR